MDWQTKGEDKLDNLPSREKFQKAERDRSNYPFRRVQAWIESKVGQHIDKIYAEFVKLEWLPKEYRNYEKFKDIVEMDTFVQEGDICYYDRYSHNYGTGAPYCILKEQGRDTLYVHPKSRCLMLYRYKGKGFNYASRYRFELHQRLRIIGDYHQYYKLNGIWYEIKAEPRPANFIPWPGRDERKGPRDILLEPNNAFTRRVSTNPYVKITLKRQLNHEELMRHTLSNDYINVDNRRCPKCGGYGMDCVHHRTINWGCFN